MDLPPISLWTFRQRTHNSPSHTRMRPSIDCARLWRSRGKRKEAHELLAPIYNWFTEGFNTKDLTEAKALLGELSA